MKLQTIILSIPIYILSMALLFGQTETAVTVRVLAHDAKLIGTSMGTVEITIRDQATGNILANGQTMGGTGNTERLVIQDKSRYGEISTPGSAAFTTTLNLLHPVYVEVEAAFHGAYTGKPIIMKQNHWLIPGKDMTGDGIMLDMSGFAMRIQHPLPHQGISLSDKNNTNIELFMIMLCGCPISPGGTWDSDPMEVEALIYEGQEFLRAIPFTNFETNRFRADLSSLRPGNYTVYVSAYDERSKNTGVEKINVSIND